MARPVVDIALLDDRAFETLSFEPGEKVFDRGDEEPAAYVVRSGKVAIEVADVIHEHVEPGAIFGEMALVDGSCRSASAIAVEQTDLFRLDQRAFLYLIGSQPYFAINVLRVMCHRLRREDRRADEKRAG